MNRKHIWQRQGMAWVLGAATLLIQQGSALACEGCKQAMAGPKGEQLLSSASVGYGLSVGFMLFMVFSVVGSLGWMIVRNCQALDRANAVSDDKRQD